MRNADAKEIAAGLTSVLGSTDGTGLAPRVAIDARSNVLLVRGTPEMTDRVRVLVADLDQPGRELPSLVPVTRVYRLQFADAASMVQVLRGVIGAEATATSSVVDLLGADVPAVQEPGIANGFGAAADIEAAAATRQRDRRQRAGAHLHPGGRNSASEDITIQAAKDINAVVIRARAEVQSDLGQLVVQLDQRRPQVLIEAAIAEISGDIAEQLGVQLGFGNAAPQAGFASTSFNNSGLALGNILRLLNVPSAVAISTGLTIGLSEEDKYGILIQALGQSTKANLLSTPSVTTLDNQAASILVGQNVPFRTGTYRHRRQRLGPLHHHRAAGHRHPAQRHAAGEPGQRHPARREPGGLLDQQRGGAGRRRHHHQPPVDPDLGARPTTAAPSCSAG